jgi:hypothetical protein
MEKTAKSTPIAQMAQKIGDAYPGLRDDVISGICAIIADTCNFGQPMTGNPVELDIARLEVKINTIAAMVAQIHDAAVPAGFPPTPTTHEA